MRPNRIPNFKGDLPKSIGDLNCNKIWCLAPTEHMEQSLQTWFVSAETLTLQVQLSSGETESACETLNHGLSLYRELNQKVLQGVVKMLCLFGPCQLVVSSAFNPADAKPWANLFGKGGPF